MEDDSIRKLLVYLERHHDNLRKMLYGMTYQSGFVGSDAADVVQFAFKHLAEQLDKGKLNKFLNDGDPAKKIESYLRNISFKDAISKVNKISKYRSKNDPLHKLTIEELENELCLRNQQLLREFEGIEDVEDKSGLREDVELLIMDLERAMAYLPPRDQIILRLHYVYGFEYEEIAEKLQTTYGAIKNRVCLSKKKLRKNLKNKNDTV